MQLLKIIIFVILFAYVLTNFLFFFYLIVGLINGDIHCLHSMLSLLAVTSGLLPLFAWLCTVRALDRCIILHLVLYILKSGIYPWQTSIVQSFQLLSISSCTLQPYCSLNFSGQPIERVSTVFIASPELLSHTAGKTPTRDQFSKLWRMNLSPPHQELHMQCTDSQIDLSCLCFLTTYFLSQNTTCLRQSVN